MEAGLEVLQRVKEEVDVPVLTDIHDVSQVERVAEVVDVLQIPAFLSRQTDLIVAAAKSGKAVNVKKGQFLAPQDARNIVDKAREAGCEKFMLTERGASFGYNNLVVDMRSFPIMREFGVPVVFDVTHSLQLPGGLGHATGGQSEYIEPLARAGVACGVDAVFMEVHDCPGEGVVRRTECIATRSPRAAAVDVARHSPAWFVTLRPERVLGALVTSISSVIMRTLLLLTFILCLVVQVRAQTAGDSDMAGNFV